MFCKDCVNWKSKDSINGVCTSPFVSDTEPPSHIKSKKKIAEWLESDDSKEQREATDFACRWFLTYSNINFYE